MRQIWMTVVFVAFGGTAFAQEIDCANASTQMDMTLCAEQDFESADQALNISYQAAIEMMQSIDADLPKPEQGAVEALKAAQRAWILVRDNTCLAEGYGWAGGSGRAMVELSCKSRLTKSRTEDLNILAEPY